MLRLPPCDLGLEPSRQWEVTDYCQKPSPACRPTDAFWGARAAGVTKGNVTSTYRKCHPYVQDPFPHPATASVLATPLTRLRAISTFLITTLTKWLSHKIIKNINKHLSSLSKQEHLKPELRVGPASPSERRGSTDEALVCVLYRMQVHTNA